LKKTRNNKLKIKTNFLRLKRLRISDQSIRLVIRVLVVKWHRWLRWKYQSSQWSPIKQLNWQKKSKSWQLLIKALVTWKTNRTRSKKLRLLWTKKRGFIDRILLIKGQNTRTMIQQLYSNHNSQLFKLHKHKRTNNQALMNSSPWDSNTQATK
jgi:hypothetical protein